MPILELKDVVGRSYDYIIVGGGTAGLVLATRLTENADASVLVLEAGKENLDDPLITKLGNFEKFFGHKEYDWGAMTIPQVNSENIVFPWSRGRVLGGSSAVNFTAWNKPAKEDIDAWEKLGNKGWNWERFNKYIQRAITYNPPKLSTAEYARWEIPQVYKEMWSKGPEGNGPIQISCPPLRTDIDIKFQQALQHMDIPAAPAPLDGNPNGFVLGAMTVDPNSFQRSFVANAYWKPNSARPNFNVLTGVVAHRLVTTDVDGALFVTGVEFSHQAASDDVYTARASREVILSAGAIMTPQILERSGIGRPDVLQKVGIPIKLALEGVGENVQDHITASIVVELKDGLPDLTYDLLRDPGEAEKQEALHAQGQGLHTMAVKNYIYAPLSLFSDKAPEIISDGRKEIEAKVASGKYPAGIVDQYRIALDKLEKVPSCEFIAYPSWFGGPNFPEPGKKYYALVAVLNSLFSRGTIHLTSPDPAAQAAIDPRYFEHEIDLKSLREVLKFCRKVGGSATLKESLSRELNPGPGVSTDEQLEDYIKRYSSTLFHAIGSASMLPREKGGVVDTQLKVYGTKNLRVVDLSIVPLHVGSHTQSIAYGIGEIASDIIKGLA